MPAKTWISSTIDLQRPSSPQAYSAKPAKSKLIPLITAILENLGSSGEKYRPEPDAHDDVVETEAVVDVLLAVAVVLLPLCVPVPVMCHFWGLPILIKVVRWALLSLFKNEKHRSLSLSTSIWCRQRRRQGRWTSLQPTAPASPTENRRKCKTVLEFKIYLNDIEGIGVDHRSDPEDKYLKARRLLSSLSSPALMKVIVDLPTPIPISCQERTSYSLYTNSKRNDDHW